MARIAQEHSYSAENLSRLGQPVSKLSDRLLTGLGSFRLPAYAKARQVVDHHPFLELLYVTNAQGRQIIENIAQSAFQATYICSMASDSFCFTISTPLRNPEGNLLSVLGADVHFGQLMRI